MSKLDVPDMTWDLIKIEFNRDFHAPSAEFSRLEDRLDTEYIKKNV